MEDFLKGELEGLPQGAQTAILKQIELAIRQAKQAAIHIGQPNVMQGYDLLCMAICGKIVSALEFANMLRRQVQEAQAASKESG